MSFQLHALPADPYAPLFDLSDAELNQRAIRRMTVDSCPGFPCRVSLADAELGEEVLLLNHQHLAGDTPFAASHAIFVRKGVSRAHPAEGAVPEVLMRRLLSLRAFDGDRMMIDADVIDGPELARRLGEMFEDPGVAYIHIHYAKPGCFAALATRPGGTGPV